jgi:hypothetical protein
MMPDTFVLYMLGKPRTIGDKDYQVAWNCELGQAEIVVVEDGELRDLHDSSGNIFRFSCELEAHRYLNGLWMETYPEKIGDESWKTI